MENNELLAQVKAEARLWMTGNYDYETKEKVQHIMEHDEKELVDAFYRWLEFGTAGLRGIMGVGPNRMNKYTVGMASQGLANYLKSQFPDKTDIKVAIAYDCRNNGLSFSKITAKILIANGIQVFIFESLRPTPELSFAVRHLNCQAGIVVTASHNPKEYNGYKVYWDDGGQIIAPHDKNLMTEVSKITSPDQVKFDGDENQIQYLGKEIDDVYLDQIKALSLSPEAIQRNHNMKIVYTPIHGTGVHLVPESLKRFGFTNIIHVPEQDVTDGNFPTVISPNPEEHTALEMALAKAKETDADLLLATDPDADRVGIAIKNNKNEFILLNGNQTGSLLIYYLVRKWAENGKLTGKEFIVKTIVTTELQADIAKKYKVEYYDVLTGFKYIGGVILENEGKKTFIAGGEESYGYLAGDFVRDKDAVSASCLIAEVAAWAKDNGKTMFELLQDIYLEFGFYKESMNYITKKGKTGADEIQKIMHDSRIVLVKDYELRKEIDVNTGDQKDITLPKSNVLQFFLEDGTKISIRPSGTEPKIKFYIGAKLPLTDRNEFSKTEKQLDSKIADISKDLGIK
jgi:phosphoglucomutase